jgi:type I restriction-modification system DNA methylase subunit/predicted DNA-binding transcriptional regulator AlpA
MSTPSTRLTITAADIADLAGVGRSTVSNWRTRRDDFPEPVAGSAANPRFDDTEVRDWLVANGKEIKGLSPDRVLWGALDALRGLGSPHEIADVASALIVWRYVSDPESPGFEKRLSEQVWWPGPVVHGDVHLIQSGAAAYESLHDTYRGVFDVLTDNRWLRSVSASTLMPLNQFLRELSRLHPEQLREAFETFHDRLTLSVKRGYDTTATSADLTDLIATLAADIPGPVHDPVVGSARMLFAVGAQGRNRIALTGQEINPGVWAQAVQRAVIRGEAQARIVLGDTILDDKFGLSNASVVVMDPPYGLRVPNPDHLHLDGRFRFGVSSSTADMLWPQIAIAHLADRGRAFVLAPMRTLFASSTGKVRKELIRQGVVEAIIGLPSGLAMTTHVPLALWILARPGQTADPERVLLIDGTRNKNLDHGALALAVRAWRDQKLVAEDLPATTVSIADLASNEWVLTPSRWIVEEKEAPTVETVVGKFDAVVSAVDEFRHTASSELRCELGTPEHAPRLVRVGDVTKSGTLTILKATGRGKELPEAADGRGIDVVDGQWIRGGAIATKTDPERLEGRPVMTRAGDVVVMTLGTLAARVDDVGHRVVVRPDHVVLRCEEGILDPDYLAAVLVTPQNGAKATGTALQRVRVQDLVIPLLPVAHQRALTEQIRVLRKLRVAAEELGSRAAVAAAVLVEGVAAGTVDVVPS